MSTGDWVMSTSTAMPYSIYPFRGADGAFDYNFYVRHQGRMSTKKVHRTFASPEVIAQIVRYLQEKDVHPRFGVCHGVRNGNENKWFGELLPDCVVLGTEIGPLAEQFPKTIRWDFHEVKPEWIGAVDFIYTNSLDHAYDPEKAVKNWVRCLTPLGRCFIEYWGNGTVINSGSPTDPFSADLDSVIRLVGEWVSDRYIIEDVRPLSRAHLPGFRVHVDAQGGLIVIARNVKDLTS
jgi:SAM-dependent methyltransferase